MWKLGFVLVFASFFCGGRRGVFVPLLFAICEGRAFDFFGCGALSHWGKCLSCRFIGSRVAVKPATPSICAPPVVLSADGRLVLRALDIWTARTSRSRPMDASHFALASKILHVPHAVHVAVLCVSCEAECGCVSRWYFALLLGGFFLTSLAKCGTGDGVLLVLDVAVVQ